MTTEITTAPYARKAFTVDAIQVTADNMPVLADWCGGLLDEMPVGREKVVKPFIQVKVKRPASPRQARAFEGDWILYANEGFKIYTPGAFASSFEPIIQLDMKTMSLCEAAHVELENEFTKMIMDIVNPPQPTDPEVGE